MSKPVKAQFSFNLGQVNQDFYRRVDNEYYWQAAKRLENIFITSQGGALKRYGTTQVKNVTDTIAGQAPVKFFSRYIYSPDSAMVRVLILLVKNVLYIGQYESKTITFQEVDLSSVYTIDQAQAATFIVVRNSILLLNREVAPHRIVFDGSNFSLDTFTFAKQATFDLGRVDYFSNTVTITPGAAVGDVTTILFTGNPFGADIGDYVDGLIVGPGLNPDAPFGVGTIKTAAEDSGNAKFEVLASTAFAASGAQNNYTGADLSVQQPIFNDDLGYPSTGAHYQNRVWFAGHPAVPTTIFGTKLGTQNNLNVGTGDPVDAIVYTSDIAGIGDFLFINVGRHFEVFSENAEASALEDGSTGLSPTNFQLRVQSNFRIKPDCAPANFQNFTFFAGLDGKSIYSFRQNLEGDENTYETKCETLFASELINNPVKLTVFSGVAGSSLMLAVLNSDNSLAIFQLSDPLKISAWTPFTSSEDIQIRDIDSDGRSLLLLVYYVKTQTYMIEEIDYSLDCFVDNAKAVEIEASETPPVVTGLDVFNGYTVYVANKQEELGNYQVLNGKITLDKPLANNFNGFVGLFYTPIIQPMDLVELVEYNYAYKAINAFYVDYINSLAVEVNNEEIPYQYFTDLENGNPLVLQSGTYEFFDQEGFKRFQSLQITQSKPVRMEISSIAYSVTNTGR